jgi:integrase/recombinase XerD
MLVETLQKEFLVERKFEGLRESTLTSYSVFFKSWNQWLVEKGVEQVEDITPISVKKYLRDCVENGINPKQ